LSATVEDVPGAVPASSGVVRYHVLVVFAALAALTYLDRICIAQAAGPIRDELGLDSRRMGYVFSAFTLAYMLFEVPTGWLGDRIGPRKVLVRVVLWWSAFTALTGWAWSLPSLLLARFAFGAGEAGAFPNIARALTRWFPPWQRARAQGVLWTTARLGGAVAHPLSVAVMALVGWRAMFAIFALLGLAWAAAFWKWYRDEPAEHPAVTPGEHRWIASWQRNARVQIADSRVQIADSRVQIADSRLQDVPKVPADDPTDDRRDSPASWGRILSNRSVWGLAAATCCGSFGWFFFATWLPTYLKEARHLDQDRAAWFASLPFVFGVVGCALGGWLSDRLALACGSTRWARQGVGFGASVLAGGCILLSLRLDDPTPAVLVLALTGFFNDLTLSSLWASAMDIGERDAGRVSGVVNTASGLGGFLSPIFYGELLKRDFGWTPALTVAGLAFFAGGLSWLLADPTRSVADPPGESVAASRAS
jgi:MFS family permease